jgi:N-methylhydantoinase A
VRTVIGVDSGGTFTDTVVTFADGSMAVGKALSTPDQVEVGVLNSISAAANSASTTLSELLRAASVITHGTTVGLNALLTGKRARVGLLTTAGFESTIAIAKANKTHGLDESDVEVPVRWRKPDRLVDPLDVVGIRERVDRYGAVLTPLDETATREAVRYLRSRQVGAVAVGLLWSCVRPDHEQRVAALVADEFPGVHVSVSSQVAPVVGEYERFATTVIDASIAEAVSAYLGRLDAELAAFGFTGSLMVLRTGGGAEPVTRTRAAPVNSLRSGPVAGLTAAASVGADLGHDRIITTDVGGTSFDVGLVVHGEPQRSGRPLVDRHPLAVPAVEVVSIGTGGGSIAWYDRDLGALRVGPRSAAAQPGPVCYGQGGTSPTLTDAAAVLGYVDRLGTDRRLDTEAARAAIERELCGPLRLSVERVAEGIVRVAADQMKDLIRRTTIQRGFDPSAFALFAFGGAGPQYASWYSEGLRLRDVVVPALAAEFSAYGAATSDIVVGAERDVLATALPDAGRRLDEVFAELDAEADAGLARAAGTGYRRRRTVTMRFPRQHRTISLPVRSWHTPAALAELAAGFRTKYEQVTGQGTAPRELTIEVVGARSELILAMPQGQHPAPPAGQARPTRRRAAWFLGEQRDCPVYRWSEVGAGQVVSGPSFMESEQSTLVVPVGHAARMDERGCFHLTHGDQHAR